MQIRKCVCVCVCVCVLNRITDTCDCVCCLWLAQTGDQLSFKVYILQAFCALMGRILWTGTHLIQQVVHIMCGNHRSTIHSTIISQPSTTCDQTCSAPHSLRLALPPLTLLTHTAHRCSWFTACCLDSEAVMTRQVVSIHFYLLLQVMSTAATKALFTWRPYWLVGKPSGIFGNPDNSMHYVWMFWFCMTLAARGMHFSWVVMVSPKVRKGFPLTRTSPRAPLEMLHCIAISVALVSQIRL